MTPIRSTNKESLLNDKSTRPKWANWLLPRKKKKRTFLSSYNNYKEEEIQIKKKKPVKQPVKNKESVAIRK